VGGKDITFKIGKQTACAPANDTYMTIHASIRHEDSHDCLFTLVPIKGVEESCATCALKLESRQRHASLRNGRVQQHIVRKAAHYSHNKPTVQYARCTGRRGSTGKAHLNGKWHKSTVSKP
jgi:hypothetical protein